VIEGAAAHATGASARDDGPASPAQAEKHLEARVWGALGDDFVLMKDLKPPPRFAYARERMLMSRLYLGLIRTLSDDYGAPFAAHSDSVSFRAIGIYVFFRTVMCSPVQASVIAHALRLPRATVLRRLQDLIKDGYVERVGNAYRVTDKVNLPDLDARLQRRIAMITETARRLAELRPSPRTPADPLPDLGEP
jgi:IclR helix-turn-helix domain